MTHPLNRESVEEKYQIYIACECGNESKINTKFDINIIGSIEFTCQVCKNIISVPKK